MIEESLVISQFYYFYINKILIQFIKGITSKINQNFDIYSKINDTWAVLFTIAFTYKNDEDQDKWDHERYKKLYKEIYADVEKKFGKRDLVEYVIYPNIDDVQTHA